MIGPPGAGKSLAARRLPSILPPPTSEEALEIARIWSACGLSPGSRSGAVPSALPTTPISAAGLIGGGNPPRAGEVTLAHGGVLFLDELCEFRRDALEALRAPLEAGSVSIGRSGARRRLPCRFMLIAAANPCPCGRGEEDERCTCAAHDVRRYQGRLSGALADRIDIVVSARPAGPGRDRRRGGGALGRGPPAGRRRRVARQHERLGAGRCNAAMTPAGGPSRRTSAAGGGAARPGRTSRSASAGAPTTVSSASPARSPISRGARRSRPRRSAGRSACAGGRTA